MVPEAVRRIAIRFQDVLYEIVVFVAKLFLIAMVIIVSYLVFMRYVMRMTPQWGHEIALGCMVWFSLLSATMATRYDRHITIRVVDTFAPAGFIKALKAFAGVVIVCFLLFMIIQGIPLTRLAIRIVQPGSGVSLAFVFAAVPVSGLTMLLMFIARLLGGQSEDE